MIFLGGWLKSLAWRFYLAFIDRLLYRYEKVLLDTGWHYKVTNRITKSVEYRYFPMLALTTVGVSFSGEQQRQIAEMVNQGNKAEAQRLILDLLDKEGG